MPNIYNKDLLNQITALLQQKMKTYRITGASLSIVDDGNTIYSEGFGFADLANKTTVNSNTIFKIGSITKIFTASAIMQLAETGKIDIDRPVKEYLAEFSVKSRFLNIRPITIRDLLCHHSGLPCDDLRNYFSSDPEAFKSVLEFLPHTYVICPPGKMFYYSNLGFDLLGVIIERISGMPYHQYIDTVLLKRLNMEKSAIILPEEWKKDISKPYSKGKEQVEGVMKEIPPGGISSTADDMAKFIKSLLNQGKGLFFKDSTLNTMFTPEYPNNPIDMNWINGLGWFIGKPGLDYAGKVLWHDGGTPNFFSLTIIIPERKLGMTILTNSSTGGLMNHLVSINILRLLLKAKYDIEPPVDKGRKSTKLTPEIIQKTTGSFITLSGIAHISKSGKKLIARMSSGTFLMSPCQDGWFNVSLFLFGIIPLKLKQLSLIRLGVPNINGERILAMEQLGFHSLQGKAYRPLNITEAWKERAGNYTCFSEKNPRLKSFKLSYSSDGMYMSVSTDKLGHLKLYLDVINNSEAVIFGYGRYSGETIFVFKEIISIFGLEFKRDK